MIDAILLALTATVAGDPGNAAPPPPAAPAAAKTEKRYCIVETIAGSHIPTRLCRTRAEWLDRGVDPLDPK